MGHNSISHQSANWRGGASQIAHAKGGSAIIQEGAASQIAHSVGQNGTIVQSGSNKGADQLATTRGNSTVQQTGGSGRDNIVSKVHGNNNRVKVDSGAGRDNLSSTLTGNNNNLTVEGRNNHTVVNDTGRENSTTFKNSESHNQINYSNQSDSRTFRVGHGLNNRNTVNMRGGDDSLTVNVANQDKHHSISVDMGAGDDMTTLNSGPRGDAGLSFQGGEGQDSFRFGGDANDVSVWSDGKLIHGDKEGKRVDISGYENFQWKDKDGNWRRQKLAAQADSNQGA